MKERNWKERENCGNVWGVENVINIEMMKDYKNIIFNGSLKPDREKFKWERFH
jgi:hypothetical protein